MFGFRIMPPDTEGDVGLEHYVQWNNLGFKIFSKAGVLLNGPNGSAGNLPWAGFGGSCETENDGDPIVIYDHVAGRWQNRYHQRFQGCLVCGLHAGYSGIGLGRF